MNVAVTQESPLEVDAGLLAVGLYEGEELPEGLDGVPGAADAGAAYEELSLLHPERPGRVVVAGLGKREEANAERLRIVAALVAKEAEKLKTSALAWLPPGESDEEVEALVTGTILGAYRFDRYKSSDPDDPPPPRLASLTVLGPEALAPAAAAARICAEAQNRARDLQSLPSNVATPSYLSRRAREIASANDSVTADVLGREEIAAKEMGGLVAVSQGTAEEPKLIVLRYAGGGSGPTLGLVGKGVTFDTGGISLKPSAVDARDEDGHVGRRRGAGGGAARSPSWASRSTWSRSIPSTENMPSGTAIKPGDVITQYNGKTVEVNNTDAEGRLILADALAYAVELGAERIVDLATLTGAVLIALGSTYAAVISNDDELAAAVEAAGETSGELVWRLPLHPEYKALTKGTVADLTNAAAKRKAGTIYAGSFLEEFVGETPWAHVDIAGTAWDVGRPYTGDDASGFGVRLLVELARELSSS